jgi:hypothetical protein
MRSRNVLVRGRVSGVVVCAAVLIGVQMGGCPGGLNPPPCSQGTLTFDGGALVTLDGSHSFDPTRIGLTFRWTQLSGTPVQLSDPQAAITTFTAPFAADTLTFQLTVTDPVAGSDTCVATVAIQCPPPAITEQPVHQTVCPEGTATFTVAATGEGPLAYQWRKGTANIANGGHYSGATTPTLSVSAASPNDVGTEYNCVVTGPCGSATSDNASLSLNPPTTITQQPANQAVCPEGTATFTVVATGAGTLSYQWRRGTVNIVNGGHYSGATTPTLTVSPVQQGDIGNDYNCVVTGTCGSVPSDNASLSESPLTTITQQPTNQSVCPDGAATFTVAATGGGTLTYQWRKGTVNVTDGGHYSGATTPTLTVSPAQENDIATDYNCVVTGACGSVTSTGAALFLEESTALVTQPTDQAVFLRGTATFSVTATGSGTLTYQWQRNGNNIADGGHFSGTTTPTLTIRTVDGTVTGTYRCIVTGNCGGVSSNDASLTILPG